MPSRDRTQVSVRLTPVLLLVAGSGCTDFVGRGCDAMLDRGIEVEVRDARSGAWVAAGASAEVQAGTYVETLRQVGWRGVAPHDTATTFGGAEERPGTYTVRVRQAGYQPWERGGIRVRRGACGVRTVRLTADLTPAVP